MKHQRTPPLTFGVLENITYALVGGIGTAIARSFLTVCSLDEHIG